jgi:tetratricopeptide (TPR) repeat protein
MLRAQNFARGLCILFVTASLLSAASGASAKIPDSVIAQKGGVVAVYVKDRAGAHVASATGIIIDSRGVVATSCFIIPKWLSVVENELLIKTEGGAESSLEYLISQNCRNGIALIKVRGTAFPEVAIASGYKPRKGDAVALITMTAEETAITEGRIKSASGDDKFQMTVPATLKRDGSPVFNAKGEVIGISTFLPGKKQTQPSIVSIKGLEREFSKYRHLIKDTPPPSFEVPRISSPPALVAPVPMQRGDGKGADAERYFALGSSYEKRNMTREAIEAYKEAIRDRPDFFQAYMNIGLLHYKLGRYDEAIDDYLNAIAIRPNDKSVYNKLGAAYIILGNYPLALDTFRQSLKIDPKNPETHFNLGVVFVITGDKTEAAVEYDILKNLDAERAAKLLEMLD